MELTEDQKNHIRGLLNSFIDVHTKELVKADELHDGRFVDIHRMKIAAGVKAKEILGL